MLRTSALALVPLMAISLRAEDKEKSLDPVLQVGGQLWKTNIDVFHKHFETHGFRWLSANKSALRSVDEELEMFGEQVGETIVRSKNGVINSVDISVFNRGDQRGISHNEYSGAIEKWQDYITKATDTRPESTSDTKDSAVKGLERRLWYTADSSILLESSWSRNGAEFIRVRLAPKPKGAFYLGNTTGRVRKQVFRGDLRRNVVKSQEGDVRIKGIPMVDQGPKGYCAVASAERVFRYYGLSTDQHEMAQLANSSAGGGTSPQMMYEALKKASNGVQLRVFDVMSYDYKEFQDWIEAYNREAKKQSGPLAPDLRRVVYVDQIYDAIDPEIYLQVKANRGNYFEGFQDDVLENIDDGIPLLWGVYLGLYPEKDIPQARGGHMRLIIGYNRKDGELIYTDSWGAGHESKRMPMDQAFAMTSGLYTVKPAR